jgi:hypothetical protein
MAVPQVDKKMLGELEAMGFPTARSVRALHFSGMYFKQSYCIQVCINVLC